MANFSCSTKKNSTAYYGYKFHISTTHFETFQHPNPAKLWIVQFSCSLYLYILCFLSDCSGVLVFGGGVALMYIIPSIRFELDFYRILCRVFCFGEILPVVRDFCSLSPRFVPPPSLLPHRGSRGGSSYRRHIHWDAVVKRRAEMHRGGALLISSHLTSLQTKKKTNIAPWWKCCDCQMACV